MPPVARSDDGSDDGGEREQRRLVQEENHAELHPLFWETMPDNPEEHPEYAAIQALRDEATPEERANTYKVNGNDKLRVGLKSENKVLLRDAIDLYTKGLVERCGNKQLDSVLCSNRAHVHSLLGNWRCALDDAQRALTLDPTNVKACFRAARAALRLRRPEQCLALVQRGRSLDAGAAKDFDAVERDAREALRQAELQARHKAEQRESQLQPVRALASALVQRQYQVTLPQVRTDNSWRPALDTGTGRLSWPCIILYPEVGSQDQIQAWDEQDTVGAQLDQMFASDAPPLEWDTDKEYTRDAVELYYLSWAGKPLTDEQVMQWLTTGQWPDAAGHDQEARPGQRQKWTRIKEAWSLHQLLSQPDFVIPGVPLLALVSKKSQQYRARFLAAGRS